MTFTFPFFNSGFVCVFNISSGLLGSRFMPFASMFLRTPFSSSSANITYAGLSESVLLKIVVLRTTSSPLSVTE